LMVTKVWNKILYAKKKVVKHKKSCKKLAKILGRRKVRVKSDLHRTYIGLGNSGFWPFLMPIGCQSVKVSKTVTYIRNNVCHLDHLDTLTPAYPENIFLIFFFAGNRKKY